MWPRPLRLRRSWSIRAQLIALVAAATIPLAGALVYSIREDIADKTESAGGIVHNLAQITAYDALATIRQAQETMQLLSLRPRVRALDPAACDPLLSDLQKLSQWFVNIVLFDGAGRVVCGTLQPRDSRLASVADREWFQQVARDKGFVIGKPFRGRITGTTVTVLAQPITGADGEVRGVLALSLDPMRYRPVTAAATLPRGAALGIVHSDGTVAWRSVDPEKWIGRNIAERESIRRMLAAPGKAIEAPGVDGQARVYSAVQVGNHDWYAYVGIPSSEVYGEVYREARRLLMIGLAGFAAALLLAWLASRRLAQPVRELAEVARAVREGALDRRVTSSGSSELADVGVQFNAMLDARASQESALRQSEQRFRALVELSVDWYWQQDEHYRFTHRQGSVLDAMGLPAKLDYGKTPWELGFLNMSESDWAAHRALLERREEFRDLLFERRSPDGRISWYTVSGRPYCDEAGRFAGYHGVGRDVTRQLLAEQALRGSESQFRATFEQAAVGIGIGTLDGRWLDVNRKLCEFLGYSREELIALGPIGVTHPDDRDRSLEMVAKVRSRAVTTYTLEKRYLRKDGEVRWGNLTVTAVTGPDGMPTHRISIIEDITPRKRYEDALRRLNEELERKVGERTAELTAANRELESFAYSVSHDLRAPLRHVNGFGALLAEKIGPTLDAEAKDLLGRMIAATQRMDNLISDLLQLSRVSRKALVREEVNLSALAGELARECQQQAPQRAVRWNIQPGLTERCDAGLARVLLANLLANAWKFTQDMPDANIEFGRESPGAGPAQYFVRDNGVGFDMAYAGKLFKPFERLHAMEQFDGTGIGLATVQRVVLRHGGSIRADAQPGLGAVFRFTLAAAGDGSRAV